jgi:dienelactone hydrolase
MWGYRETYDDSHALRRNDLAQLDAYIGHLMDTAERDRHTRWALDYRSEEAYVQSLEPLRAQLERRLGYPLPGAQPSLPASWTQLHANSTVTIYRAFIPIRDGLNGYGLYFQHPDTTTLRPLLVCMHGGGGFPEIVSNLEHPGNYGHMVERAFAAGFHVWAPHALFPDRWSDLPPTQRRRALDAKAKLAGTSLAAIDLCRIREGLSVILERQEVDADRVGMVGLSYGGYYALFVSALDPRIKATVSSCYFNDRRSVLTKGLETDAFLDWHFFGLLGDIADEQLVALVCPRPLVIEVGERDELFPADGAQAAYERARECYDRLGIADRLHFEVFEGGHEFNGESGFAMLTQHLLG